MTNRAWGLTVLRVVVGIVFAVHGGQKVFFMGMNGVAGFLGSLGIPAPAVAAVVLMAVEFLGGIALILGVVTRWAALLLAIDMLVAILLVHLKRGFFAHTGGYEFALTLLAACVALALAGPGAAAVDDLIAKRA